jgi:hypothetical protein
MHGQGDLFFLFVITFECNGIIPENDIRAEQF